ncbi:MAG: hypothetical protein FWE10_00570 [Rikenellaceae bacterium]|nr:hypothetical protein [Rikenellaceae bacterium]MCL2692231.1 hypothetical protein [Rikenellaceae bacterium]
MEKKRFQKQLLTVVLILILPYAFIVSWLIYGSNPEVIPFILRMSLLFNFLFIAHAIVVKRNKLIKFDDEAKRSEESEKEKQ